MKEHAINFLRRKGILAADCTHLFIKFDDGRKFDFVELLEKFISEPQLMEKTQYLVRPHDFHIFEIDPHNDCYRSYSTRTVTDSEGNRQNAQNHFTYESLTNDYNFIPASENELEYWENMHDKHMDFVTWQCRSDGHGGSKGGTLKEYEAIQKK